MASRSKREHKPTIKFLSYYTQELASGNNASLKTKKPSPAKAITPKSTFTKVTIPKSLLSKSTLPKSKVSESAKQPLVREENKDATQTIFSPSCHSTNTSIRKSSRQHKPNQNLKGFLKPSSNDYVEIDVHNPITCNALPKKPIGSSGTKNVSKKFVAAVSPMVRKEGIKTPIKNSQHLSVGLVDCFQGLTDDLSEMYPTGNAVKEIEQEGAANERSAGPVGGGSRSSEAVVQYVSVKRRGIKRALKAEVNENEPSIKQQRMEASMVRNMTKTKKTKITTVVETVDIDANQKKKTVTQNRESKFTKQYPIRKKTSLPSSEEELEEDEDEEVVEEEEEEEEENEEDDEEEEEEEDYIKPQSSHSLANSISTTRSPINRKLQQRMNAQKIPLKSPPQPQKDIRETLKKFLIMGTKVANAISETLKHNEEALLSKSSSFEKKCLSLVHALATQGADLEEDDMEKVLKLLDEEQEERRIYRQTFLESLRVSHLTNMALYSQMLRLLKTL